MSNQPKRRRGRPKGSGRDDSVALDRVANLLIAHPGMKPTSAIRNVLGTPHPSDIRRLQVKWKADGNEYLDAARKRQATVPARSVPGGLFGGAFSHMAATTAAIESARLALALDTSAIQSVLRSQQHIESLAHAAKESARFIELNRGAIRTVLENQENMTRIAKIYGGLGRFG